MKSESITQNINFKCSSCSVDFSKYCQPFLSCRNCHSLCEKCFYQIKQNGRASSVCPSCKLPIFQETIINKCLLRQIETATKYRQLQLKCQRLSQSQIKNQQLGQSSKIKNDSPSIYKQKSSQKQQSQQKTRGQEIAIFLKQNNLTIMGAIAKMTGQLVRIISSFGLFLLIFGLSYRLWQFINTKNQKTPQLSSKVLFLIANTILIIAYICWGFTVAVCKLFYPIIRIVRPMIQFVIYGIPIGYLIQQIIYLVGYYDKLYFNLLIEPARAQMKQYILIGVCLIIPWVFYFYKKSKKQKIEIQKMN